MTRPGDRSQNLRKLTAEELSWGSEGWADESFPRDAVQAALRNKLQPAQFPEFYGFLGPRLGFYRATQAAQSGSPPVAKELRLVDELVAYSAEFQTRVKHLPPSVEMLVTQECWKRNGVSFDEFMHPHYQALTEVSSLLVLAARRLEPHGNQPGAKSLWHRDWLLHDIAAKLLELGMRSKLSAAGAAAAVLDECRIPAPTDEKEVAALIRKAAKRLEGEE